MWPRLDLGPAALANAHDLPAPYYAKQHGDMLPSHLSTMLGGGRTWKPCPCRQARGPRIRHGLASHGAGRSRELRPRSTSPAGLKHIQLHPTRRSHRHMPSHEHDRCAHRRAARLDRLPGTFQRQLSDQCPIGGIGICRRRGLPSPSATACFFTVISLIMCSLLIVFGERACSIHLPAQSSIVTRDGKGGPESIRVFLPPRALFEMSDHEIQPLDLSIQARIEHTRNLNLEWTNEADSQPSQGPYPKLEDAGRLPGFREPQLAQAWWNILGQDAPHGIEPSADAHAPQGPKSLSMGLEAVFQAVWGSCAPQRVFQVAQYR